MSNESKRPWYRMLKYLIPIIVVILGAILGPIMWNLFAPPPADFSISVNPMEGQVQQGGVGTTAITIKGINRYEHPVSLSASDQPSGVIVTFVPPLGEPIPSYTSNVMINVGPDVSPASYEITIKGIGADGKEHNCKYILSVIHLETTEKIEIKIISPKEGDEVLVSTKVMGTFSGELSEGQYMWVVVNPHPCPDLWWPQGWRINPQEEWDIDVGLGQEKEDIGEKFDIAVILVNKEDDQYYWDYLKTGQETGSYPGIPLPASANIRDRITVIRK